jgi:hypothetical protein
MRSQLPPCQLTPERAAAVWSQFSARALAPRDLPLAETPVFSRPASLRHAAFMADHKFAAHEALDCLGSEPLPKRQKQTHELARDMKGPAADGRAITTHMGTSEHIEHNRVPLADPAGRGRARRLSNGNAHAYRCAPPGRNAGGGTQGQSD